MQPAGVQAETIFGLWNFTLALCTAVFVAVLLALGLALWKARQARRAQTDGAPDLEPLHRPERRVHRIVLWATVISTVGLLMLFVADAWTARALARRHRRDTRKCSSLCRPSRIARCGGLRPTRTAENSGCSVVESTR